MTRSEAEELMLALVRAADLPAFETNRAVAAPLGALLTRAG